MSLAQPSATVQFIGGYSMPTGDFTGSFPDRRIEFTGNDVASKYLLKSGVNYGIFIKIPFAKKSPLSYKFGIGFNAFSQSREYTEDTVIITASLSQSILGINAGAEFDFSDRKSKVRPFVGAEISLNFISGSHTNDFIDSTKTLDMKGATRVGLNLSAGVDVVLHNNLGVLVGAKYAFANIIGKNFQEDTRVNYGLNDAAHSNGTVNLTAKNITFFQFYGGISFYFGR